MLPVIILLDTNVLYHSLDYGIQIQDAVRRLISRDWQIYVHSMVQAEIIKDLSAPNKLGRQAKFAMQLMTEFEPYEDDREYPGTDTALLETARRIGGVVFTYDKGLRDRCRAVDIPVITHHTKGKVQLIGYVR